MPGDKNRIKKSNTIRGSTLKDHRKIDGNLGYFQHQFKVYNCDGQACSRCLDQNTIIKTKQNQRSTFYCPNCQI